jgi:hypothetical protein
MDGEVLATDLLASIDERSLVLARRGGGVAAIDLETGQRLWRALPSASMVYDLDVADGLVSIAGAARADTEQGAALTPVVSVFDAFTGEPLRRLSGFEGFARWTRSTPWGVLVGAEDGVWLYDPGDGRTVWAAKADGAQRTADAWVLGDRLHLLDQSRELWSVSMADGSVRGKSLATRERLSEQTQIRGEVVDQRAMFATRRGFVLYDAAGELVGIDAMDAQSDLLPAATGQGYLVNCMGQRVEMADGKRVVRVMVFESATGRIVASRNVALEAEPQSLILLDGAVVISTDLSSVVIPSEPAGR